MTWHVKNTDPKGMKQMLYNLRSKAVKTAGNSKADLTKIPGKYRYLGSKGGYDVYEPLSVTASMALGVGSGWCTTGRYGHAGDLNFKPSLKDAKEHWDAYKSKGIRLFYFLQDGIAKYAIALYPEKMKVNEWIGEQYVRGTNIEVLDQEDHSDYDALKRLPVDLLGIRIIYDVAKTKDGLLLSRDGKKVILANGNITSVVIPDGVTTIGKEAFHDCRSLTSVTIPNSVTSIGNNAFRNCLSLTSVNIPNSVTFIGDAAFGDCKSLTSVTIPDSVTFIGDAAFCYCESLTSVNIPNSVTHIGNAAFDGCESLTSVNLPDSITEIGSEVFSSCHSLTSITIPNSVTSIGWDAFGGCRSLKSVTIPDSVIKLGEEAFSYCSSLTSVTIGNSVTSIGKRAFDTCHSLTSVTIGNSVASIGYGAFSNCLSLPSINIPDSVLEIDWSAFFNCSALKSATIGNRACKVSGSSFPETTSIKYADGKAFRKFYDDDDDEDADEYEVDESLMEAKADRDAFISKFGKDVFDLFQKSKDRLKNANISTDMTWHVKNTDPADMKQMLYNLRSKAVKLDGNSETNKVNLTKIPGKYRYLGSKDGYDVYEPLDVDASMALGVGTGWCTTGRYGHARDLNFKPSLKDAKKHWDEYTSKGIRLFYFLQDGIGKYAIALYPQVLPVAGRFEIAQDAQECVLETNVEVFNQEDYLIDYDTLKRLPLDLLDVDIVYKVAEFKDGLALSEDGKTVVVAKKDITSAVIPEGVISIGNQAFSLCSSLTSVTIPDSVTSIGNLAFASCSSLASVTIPDSVTSIGWSAFSCCYSLTSVNIPDSVTSIGKWAFFYCKSLKLATIGNRSCYIERDAFPETTQIEYADGKAAEEALDEASTAEKRAYKNGGEDLDDLLIGRTIASIKTPSVKNAIINTLKSGDQTKVNAIKDLIRRDPRLDDIDNAYIKKAGSMQRTGLAVESKGKDGTVLCSWCGEERPLKECKHEHDLGWVCPECERAKTEQGEKLVFDEALEDWEDISKNIQQDAYMALTLVCDLVQDGASAYELYDKVAEDMRWDDPEVETSSQESEVLKDLIHNALEGANEHEAAEDFELDTKGLKPDCLDAWYDDDQILGQIVADFISKNCKNDSDKISLLGNVINSIVLNGGALD